MWTVPDRPDLFYAVKELARHVCDPSETDWLALKRVLRYLKGALSRCLRLGFSDEKCDEGILVVVDANWASGRSYRSTSGGAVFWDGFLIQHWARTQGSVSQSSCESEMIALSVGASEGKFVQSMLAELGKEVNPICLYSDSSSAVALTFRRGMGRLRHLAIKQLWLQEETKAGRVSIFRVTSEDNVADVFTKPLLRPRFLKLCDRIGMGEPA